MPVYSFLDKNTDEEFSAMMTLDEKNQYLEDNENLQQVFKMNIGDPIRLGVTRPSSDFRRVLQKAKQAPGSLVDTGNLTDV